MKHRRTARKVKDIEKGMGAIALRVHIWWPSAAGVNTYPTSHAIVIIKQQTTRLDTQIKYSLPLSFSLSSLWMEGGGHRHIPSPPSWGQASRRGQDWKVRGFSTGSYFISRGLRVFYCFAQRKEFFITTRSIACWVKGHWRWCRCRSRSRLASCEITMECCTCLLNDKTSTARCFYTTKSFFFSLLFPLLRTTSFSFFSFCFLSASPSLRHVDVWRVSRHDMYLLTVYLFLHH